MASKKTFHAVASIDLLRVFDDMRVDQLSRIGELPASADRQRFADSIREAARIYARDARKPKNNDVRDEIERLHKAASQGKYERVAVLIETLSPELRRLLETRARTPGFEAAGLKIPSSSVLRDPIRREQACDVIRRFCSFGGSYIEGRMRRTGKRSITWKPLLPVPESVQHPPKRETERQFVTYLQLAWIEATEKLPPATVNPSRSDRPFANLVRECLRLVGAGHADAVALINDLNVRRREMRKVMSESNS